MIDSSHAAPSFAAGFEFSRRLRDRTFRERLKQYGWEPGQEVVMTDEHEPVMDVVARIILHEMGKQAVVAMPDAEDPSGFCLMTFRVAPSRRWTRGRRRKETIPIAPSATMGMLYQAFDSCGEYVPSEWASRMIIRKEPEPA